MTAAAWNGVMFVAALGTLCVLAAAGALLWTTRHPDGLIARLGEATGVPADGEEWPT